MSDESLSQNELEALLGDFEPSDGANDPNQLNGDEKKALTELFAQIASQQSETLSGNFVKQVNVGSPQMQVINAAQLQADLPEEMVEIPSAFKSGLSGMHLFLINEQDSLVIATSMMGQEDLEFNGAVINAVGEALGHLESPVAAKIGELMDSTIMFDPPEGQKVPKETISFPPDPFIQLSYKVDVDGKDTFEFHEIFEFSTIKEITKKLLSSSSVAANEPESDPLSSLLSGEPTGGVEDLSSPEVDANNIMEGLGTSMSAGAPTPNVQSVQLSGLSSVGANSGEQKNISLLMDVSMELTVELGRTRWKIKDILSMGDGTIIELDKLAGEPVDILVNNNMIAKGEVVVIDENFGVRITEIISSMENLNG